MTALASPSEAGLRVLLPTTAGEVRDALLDTAGSRPRIGVRGTGTADAWATPAGPVDVEVDAEVATTELRGVLRYNPADMTMAVRAGTPLAEVQEEVGRHGQRVAFDPARAALGATVGGLLATADGGPARHAQGTLRDLVIGVTVVLGDGTVARSGGHVIKNVAGYDLAKLFSGSFGTLGVVAEVVLRLHPLPRASATVAVPVEPAQAHDVGDRIVGAGLEPSALELCDDRLLVRFDGTPEGVARRAKAVAAAVERPVQEAADTDWATVAATALGEPGDTVLRLGTLPSAGPGTLAALPTAGLDTALSSTVMSGVHTLRLRGGSPAAHAEVLRAAHAAVGPACTVLRRDGLPADAPAWGPPPRSVAVLRAVKQRFDPTGRFPAARLAPWLDPEGVRA